MFQFFVDQFAKIHTAIFESVVQPLLFMLGMVQHAESAYDATFWLLVGLIEIALLAVILGWAERRFPVEPVTDHGTVWTDRWYTVLHRLGGFALIVFFLVQPLADSIKGSLSLAGFQPIQVDKWLDWCIEDLSASPWFSFLTYLVVLDFADYWIHRAQHRFNPWWQLHALHHAQRQMTFWSDDRNHLLDDLIRDALLALLALVIGVAPAQFVGLIVLTRCMESLQHANLKLQFPMLLERILVSPSFHRLHHAIGYGHEGRTQGCNFGVLFSFWDRLFGTADWRPGFVPTGVRDQMEGRDYGRGFWQQQWFGLRRLFGKY